MMDKIEIKLIELKEKHTIILDNIRFTDCYYLQISINDCDIKNLEGFADMLIVYDELYKSHIGSGNYLLFTCACGIADDGGWDFIDVIHTNEYVEWYFFREKDYKFKFLKTQYIEQILNIRNKNKFIIPKMVIFPE